MLLLSCTDNGLSLGVPNGESANGGLVRMELNIYTPEAFSTRNSTRAITEDCDSTLDGRFAVFGFTYEGSDTILQFVLKTGELTDDSPTYSTGDTNTGSNLNDASSAYGDYTGTPSIAWHAANESSTSGRLYIEYWETTAPVHLLVLANVDSTAVAALLTEDAAGNGPAIAVGESTFEDVTNAIAPALDFNVYDETINSIPMAAECELESGITLGSTGSISLRRSVAKFTVRVEYTGERAESYFDEDEALPFQPESLQIVNVNTYATVYAPNDTLPNISTLNNGDYDPNYKVSPEYSFAGDWTYDSEADVWYQEVVFYVAETLNSKQAAYTANGDGNYTQNTENPRISVLVGGTYYDYDGSVLSGENWYRLDLIPESAESSDEELDNILRNHHYRFVISDATKRGSSSELEALEMSLPDNEPHVENEGYYVFIEDEDIVSVTVETNTTSEGEPYYVGVSSTSIEIDIVDGTSACARVKIATNFENWGIDEYGIPYATDGNGNTLTDNDGSPIYAISFVWDSASQTLWLWLDYPDDVVVGETYAYYIVAGNIRKKMRITIVDSSATDTGGTGSDTGGDTEPEPDEEP